MRPSELVQKLVDDCKLSRPQHITIVQWMIDNKCTIYDKESLVDAMQRIRDERKCEIQGTGKDKETVANSSS